MKVLYSRMAKGRKREYQIITKIVLIDGKRYVVKEAACIEAQKHIEDTYRHEEILAGAYQKYLVPGQLSEGKLITPFVEGVSLGVKLREMLKDGAEEEQIRCFLKQWKKIIKGNEENVCKFIPSKEFEAVFGKADELKGKEATCISNFDCSAENIFFTEEGTIKVIDYEWVFPFHIPVDLSFYRVLKMFYECNRGLVDWKRLIELAEIGICEFYDKLIYAFSEYVSLDKERHIDYSLMGKKFKIGKILDNGNTVFQYRFPYHAIPEGKSIILYGAGRVGEDFYNLIKKTDYCRLIAWMDKNASLYRKQGLPVVDVDEIDQYSYDYILIAVYHEKTAQEIGVELQQYGVMADKMKWELPKVL